MKYKFIKTEEKNDRISVVFVDAAENPLKVEAGAFLAGRYPQKDISVKEQQQAAAALINTPYDPQSLSPRQ